MPSFPRLVLSVRDLDQNQIAEIFNLADKFKTNGFDARHRPKIVSLVFLEPSTRTRLSFEIAGQRLGVATNVFAADNSTSMGKGETALDSFKNIVAMEPDLIVFRHSGDVEFATYLPHCPVPLINGGDGKNEHPTQALLDAFTIIEKRGSIESEKILFVGDVEHSRVARSGLKLFRQLGAEVAYCSPAEWAPRTEDWREVKGFQSVPEAMGWATVCIGLRIQSERHTEEISPRRRDEITLEYALSPETLSSFRHDGIVMHPGPFIPGVDLVPTILEDKRVVIYDQVKNGVFVRAALMSKIMNLEGVEP